MKQKTIDNIKEQLDEYLKYDEIFCHGTTTQEDRCYDKGRARALEAIAFILDNMLG